MLVPDRAGLFVTSPEFIMLAMDGARKQTSARLTLAELGFMLQDFEFPFPDNQLPSVILEKALRDWTQQALNNPRLPGAASARFLHAMAARQTPALDLSSSGWTAEQYTLTHLELFAFFAAFADGAPGVNQQVAAILPSSLVDPHLIAGPLDRLLRTIAPGALAASPRSTACSPLAAHYQGKGEQLNFEQNNKTMEGLLGSVGTAADQAGGVARAAAKALEAISNAFKIQKLVLLYSSIDMELTADQGFVHKPHPGEKRFSGGQPLA